MRWVVTLPDARPNTGAGLGAGARPTFWGRARRHRVTSVFEASEA